MCNQGNAVVQINETAKTYSASTFIVTWPKQCGLLIAHDYSNIAYSVNAGEFLPWLTFTWDLSSVRK